MMQKLRIYVNLVLSHFITPRIFRILCPNIILTEGYEYGSFHFLEPSFLHNYTDSTPPALTRQLIFDVFCHLIDVTC
ncbi:ankyrin-repeat containing protein [Paenibacillus phage Vegas]|uniref:Ankyrin-repeat containing protein n=3 Tax=Vegasvirus vegas TaxID=2034999 RepID=A0A0K2CZS3_9CAUD|nr:ankyrin-repeat containing protein [Paenibacillus phage Vegas]ALA12732.1 ankyrin-repeat containing protein [Paenibacillus phage Vegas]ALA12902.1 ankyrin-repeat containing protein [Paenibacillus phage Vadim]ALA12988.1 ankyrin-repeat containing protein [Paenibacillus phage Diane]